MRRCRGGDRPARGTPVVAGTTDGCAAQLGAGVLRPGSWNSVLGTTLVLKGVSRELVHDPSGAVYSHKAPNGDWLPGGASSTGAGAISRDFPDADLDELNRQATAYEPSGALTYPLVSTGERFPFVAPQAQGFRLGSPTDDGDRFAGVLQGVAFVERLCFDHLDLLGAPLDGDLVLTGGATRSALLVPVARGRPRPSGDAAGDGRARAGHGRAGRVAGPRRGRGRGRDGAGARGRRAPPGQPARFTEPYLRFVHELERRGWLPVPTARHARVRGGREDDRRRPRRHGETVWHAENRYAGVSDVALTPRGEEQAAQLAAWTRTAGLVAVWSSPLSRARRTAQGCAMVADLPLDVDARLRELDFGEGEGLTSAEMAERFPDARAAFLADPVAHHLPGGEDPVTAAQRFTDCLQEITEKHPDGRVLVVAHSSAIRLALCRLIGVPLQGVPAAVSRAAQLRAHRAAAARRAGRTSAVQHPTPGGLVMTRVHAAGDRFVLNSLFVDALHREVPDRASRCASWTSRGRTSRWAGSPRSTRRPAPRSR